MQYDPRNVLLIRNGRASARIMRTINVTLFDLSGQAMLLAFEGERQIASALTSSLASAGRRVVRFIAATPGAPLLP